MKTKIMALIAACAFCFASATAQKVRSKPVKNPPQVIFAVLYDGTGIEPIARIAGGKLLQPVDDNSDNKTFSKLYYKSGSKYSLIFGGAPSGNVAVKKSNVETECGGVSAEATFQSEKTKLTGFVMALATNFKPKSATGFRRKPTAAERAEIEQIVRAEYKKKGVDTAALKNLRNYNLTAVAVDNDGKAEFIGSFWVAPDPNERDLLFFIAGTGPDGRYALALSDYSAVKPDGLMSGDVKDLDTMGGELLIDVLDYDNDGENEIFTIEKAFEGNNYYVYKRSGGKWTRVFETYDYRCAY